MPKNLRFNFHVEGQFRVWYVLNEDDRLIGKITKHRHCVDFDISLYDPVTLSFQHVDTTSDMPTLGEEYCLVTLNSVQNSGGSVEVKLCWNKLPCNMHVANLTQESKAYEALVKAEMLLQKMLANIDDDDELFAVFSHVREAQRALKC